MNIDLHNCTVKQFEKWYWSAFNKKCISCLNSCKQSYKAKLLFCPIYKKIEEKIEEKIL